MFQCFGKDKINIPEHIAVIPELFDKDKYLELIEWGIQHNLKELSLFVWPNSYWNSETINTVELQQEWTSLYEQLSQCNCRYEFVTSNSKLPVVPIKTDGTTLVRMYVSYGFDESLSLGMCEHLGTNPDVLICTGGSYSFNNFCMHQLGLTRILFTYIPFKYCDKEVMDELLTDYV
tara:strand:+ start:1064 stop:1591 length:528 start_codon:yes stop_codon:yes gene_type:complete